MGLIECASSKSVWRGVDYCNEKKVISWEKTAQDVYDGTVSGNEGRIYTVHIDKGHPRKSTCTCPFATDKRVICKHMIALLFTAEPQTAEKFLEDVERWEQEYKELEEERINNRYRSLWKYVKMLSKEELQEELVDALMRLEERW